MFLITISKLLIEKNYVTLSLLGLFIWLIQVYISIIYCKIYKYCILFIWIVYTIFLYFGKCSICTVFFLFIFVSCKINGNSLGCFT